MPGRLTETVLHEPLAGRLREPPQAGLCFYWLGQAGFVIDIDGKRMVIDPYLSDTLAEKHKGTPRPHIRMMPPPVLPEEIAHIDLVLCTHAHTDHMDPGTLRPLLSGNPNALLLAPRAMRQQALERADIAEDRLILISASEIIAPFSNLSIAATASAHEALETDTNGNHRFLGYAIDMPLAGLWHSGDCIPYPGLEQAIVTQKPDIVLLPVNGRRPELSEHGVPGNFTLQEAIDLACAAGATDMIAHHYGLFDFNTEDPNVIDAAAVSTQDIHIHRAQTGLTYMWQPE